MKKLGFVIILLGVIAFAMPSQATIIFDYNIEFSDAQSPVGDAPWLRATFEDTDTNEVTLTFTALNLTDDEAVGLWMFNVEPFTALSFVHYSGVVADSILTSIDAYKADGDGFFDIQFDFNKAFGVGSTSVYIITGNNITENSFYFLSSPTGATGGASGGKGPFYSAAHVQSIDMYDDDNDGSGWVAPVAAPVPEPITMLLLGFGLIGLAGFRRK